MNAKWRPFTDEIIYYWNKFFEHTAMKGFLAVGGTLLTMIFEDINATIQSYLGILQHCDSHNLKKKIFGNVSFTKE